MRRKFGSKKKGQRKYVIQSLKIYTLLHNSIRVKKSRKILLEIYSTHRRNENSGHIFFLERATGRSK